MATIGWRFPPLLGGNEQGYTNAGIETFKGVELIDNLARETCQNSLDAKDLSVDAPVIVKFELRKMKKSQFDVFGGYERCIRGCKEYWGTRMDPKLKNFIHDVDRTLSQEDINVLVVGDYNTSGLNGSHSSSPEPSGWRALTRSDGTSVKKGDDSAGSYGIGKNAPFACSSLSTVFYNTYASDDGQAFVGVARLATLLDEGGNDTVGIGHYENNGENKWFPIYMDDICEFRDEFKRTEYGTDIIILGFDELDEWDSKIARAVIKNFFLAIYEEKLVVHVSDNIIDASTLQSLLEEYSACDKEIRITSQLFEAIVNPDRKEYVSILSDNDAEIYIKSNSGYDRTIANFRSTGMLVGKKSRRIFQHYAAVLVVRGNELSALLQDTEPTKHNKWDYKLISYAEKDKRKKAKNCIERLDELIIKYLREQYEVAIEQTVDADVGEYLPDIDSGIGNSDSGEDILRVNQKIDNIRRKNSSPPSAQVSGHKDMGNEKKGDIHNKVKNPKPKPVKPPKPVEPKVDGETGVSQGPGKKVISFPNITGQRAFPINAQQGIYKIILRTDNNYDDIYISLSAKGEDGSADPLSIEYYMHEGKRVKAHNEKVGPISLKKDITEEVVVTLITREKMVLNLTVTEEKAQ